MNKLIIAIFTTVLLSTTATAFARDFSGEPGKKTQRGHRSAQLMPVVDQFMRAIRQLELDEEQKRNIKAVLKGLRTDVHPLMKEARRGHLELRELIKAESYDEQAVAALAETEGNLAAERIVLTGKALSQVLGYLTDEQRTQLDTMAAERKKQRGGEHENVGKEG
jgi:Spy/CpxP family protein refolding chaperone